ncbi:MAG: EAL domain-containing protein [Psychromonas sp.]|nr:EAL domain-containing protein [Psychromonas sp.]
MKLLIVEDINIKKHLIDNAIRGQRVSSISFTSIHDVIEHVRHDSTPFILISEIIGTAELQMKKMQKALTFAHFKGIIFLSKYGDDIIDVAKQMARYMGFDNIHGMRQPATASQIKSKIVHIVNSGTNRVLINKANTRLDIDEIEMALVNDLFQPYFQAQVCSSTEKVKGFEILSRLCIAEYVYTPDLFIDVLIEHKRITHFTFMMLNKALSLLKNYNKFNGVLSINVDYQSLREFDFAKHIIKFLKQAEFPANRFTVEITENSPTINIVVMHNLALFRMAGCQVSIDDFGTKSSGFTELLKLPFSELKIDKHFVHEMQESPRAYKVVKALCAVAKSLDCTIVAEGVETQQQRALLRELNVCHIQGYLYSKPQPFHEAMKLLNS